MLRGQEVTMFLEGLANQLEIGIFLSEALERMASSLNEKHYEVILAMANRAGHGDSFSSLIIEYNFLPKKLVGPINSGEVAGTLPDVLLRLVEHERKFEEKAEKSKKAIAAPGVILGLVIVVFIFFLLYVYPNFAQMLPPDERNKGLFWLSNKMVMVVETMPWIFLIPVALIFLLCRQFYVDAELRNKFFESTLKLPIYGYGMKQVLWASWCNYVSISVRAGVPFVESVRATSPMLTDEMSVAFYRLCDEALDGRGWDAALNEGYWERNDPRGEWPQHLQLAFKIGGTTGNLGELLDKAGHILERNGSRQIDKAVNVGNKIALGIAGSGVGALIITLLVAQSAQIQSI